MLAGAKGGACLRASPFSNGTQHKLSNARRTGLMVSRRHVRPAARVSCHQVAEIESVPAQIVALGSGDRV